MLNNIPQEILDDAEQLYKEHLPSPSVLSYPDDEWFSLSDNWDLNLWTRYDNEGSPTYRAIIYPVFDTGCTNTNEWHILH